MKKILLILFLFLYGTANSTEQTGSYQFSTDLNKADSDKLEIELITPLITEDKIAYRFPAMIPGTYKILNFGYFIEGLKAFDKNGDELATNRLDINSWEISNSNQLYKLIYKVNDTFDDTSKEAKNIWPMAGTNIQAGKNFVFNNHGFFGYFDNYLNNEYIINIKKPQGFYGATSLIKSSEGADMDLYITPNYQFLVDNPIMYSLPDTASVVYPECKVLIATYSPGKNISANDIKDNLKDLLDAHRRYYGGTLPADRYSFIMYFTDDQKMMGIGGALEHNMSSFYFFPDVPKSYLNETIDYLMKICSHEFYHIITPLNLHAEQIGNFDFNNPQMSEHLWLYEGVTEYSAHYIPLKEGLTPLTQFINTFKEKMESSMNYDDKLPFTELSKGALNKYASQYLNVYQKGALIGMCLDILIRSETNGETGLQDVINVLLQRYGKDKSFKDEDLFREFTELTSPKIGEFFQKYVGGPERLPYKDIYEKIGVEYTEKAYNVIDGGGFSMNFNPETFRMYFMMLDENNETVKSLGLKPGDEIYSMNGDVVNYMNLKEKFGSPENPKNLGDKLEVEVFRKNAEGKFEKIKLTGEVKSVKTSYDYELKLKDNVTEEQKRIRNAWAGTGVK